MLPVQYLINLVFEVTVTYVAKQFFSRRTFRVLRILSKEKGWRNRNVQCKIMPLHKTNKKLPDRLTTNLPPVLMKRENAKPIQLLVYKAALSDRWALQEYLLLVILPNLNFESQPAAARRR